MKRRVFALALGAAPLLARPAWAAAEAVEGKNYIRLSSTVPVAVPGKIEVIEFFGYWCPHCNAFEPKLEAWVKQLPADVNFRRIPVNWRPAQHEPYQKLYFALEVLGLGEGIQQKVFDAVHLQGLRLETDAGLTAFTSANGIDKGKLVDAIKSFSVASKSRAATQLATAYRVDGVPTLGINGRYLTSPEVAGGEVNALQVADALIRKARTER
jgi:thiol:disulfide interchange protein DsbA